MTVFFCVAWIVTVNVLIFTMVLAFKWQMERDMWRERYERNHGWVGDPRKQGQA